MATVEPYTPEKKIFTWPGVNHAQIREEGRTMKWVELEQRIAELEAELDASGVDDALEWEKFPEYERLLYALAEHEMREDERVEREIAAEVAEVDELVELAEMAEECAMVELEVYGCIEFEPQFNWSAKSTPEDFGWSWAVLDIIAAEGAADAESLFELF